MTDLKNILKAIETQIETKRNELDSKYANLRPSAKLFEDERIKLEKAVSALMCIQEQLIEIMNEYS